MRRGIAVVLTCLMCAAAASAVVHPAPARAVRPGFDLLAQRGFGDPRNVYAWSMAWFKGRLYVGTARQEACVENITVDFYLRVSGRYRTNPLPNVRCPRNPYALGLRAELWQYTPRTGRWRMAYRSPSIPNPLDHGMKIARDIAYRGMAVYRGRLYIGGVTADEYIPPLRRRHPPRILSTRDGRHFRATPARGVIVRTPHGINRPMGFRSMARWHGRLYVTATPGLTGDGAVFRVTHPWSRRRARFRQVSPAKLAVFEIQRFGRSLYLGTGDRTRGYGVWRLSGHRARTRRARVRYSLRPIVTDGAGRGPSITSVVSMHVFRHRLYVGSSGWYNPEQTPSSELIRINRQGEWTVVAGATRTVAGRIKGPISGLGDGFYNIFTAHFWRMASYHGALYVGTNDWSWLVQKSFPGLQPSFLPGVVQTVLSPDFGFDLWASCNGRDWFPVTRNAFGGDMYDFGARNLVATPRGLFVGSANQAHGTKIWRTRVSPCESLVHRARAASADPGAPQRVLTDKQRAGTVVSWRASAGATRYRVMRAAFVNFPLTLGPPIVMPDGFQLEGQVPDVVAPGTPGAKQIDVPVMGNFAPVGSARASFYVDRTAKRGVRYAYRVVAVGASGHRSPPSAMQTAPDPRPVPTFGELRRVLGRAGPDGALASAARIRARRGDRRTTLTILARLRRSVGPDSDAGDLVERLERHIRFANVAGGD